MTQFEQGPFTNVISSFVKKGEENRKNYNFVSDGAGRRGGEENYYFY